MSGIHSNCILKPIPLNNTKSKIITQEIKKLMNPAVTTLIGKISLGKYTFLIIPPLIHTQLQPVVIQVVKKFHGITPVIK